MNCDVQLERALAAWPLFQQDDRTLEVESDGVRLSCGLVALDSLACAFRSFALRADSLVGASLQRLSAVSGSLSKRLTYLLEPISPIEIDVDRCIVQLRSTPPKKQADHVDYYELLVTRAGELALARYSRAKGAERVAIPAQVTREVLVRLAGDFETAARAA